jgi:predicted transcriptional regulator
MAFTSKGVCHDEELTVQGINIRISDTMRQDLELLAMKDRRTPSQLLRFAAENYLMSRVEGIRALRAAQAKTKVNPAAIFEDYLDAGAERSCLMKAVKKP